MNTYQFIYRDGTGITVTHAFKFDSDAEALDVACLTYERFGVEVVHYGRSVGRFPPHMAIGIRPRDDVILT